MKIKSHLLGSAAALIAVSGAQAADAVIVEPEPTEYVRICDAYGTGFFYIPGTERCLKYSGYVRVTYRSQHYHDADPNQPLPTHRHRVRYRGRFDIDARNETEWGILRSQLRFQGGDSGAAFSAEDTLSGNSPTFRGFGDAAVGIDRALINLAGFRLGYSNDYWVTISDYGYYVAVADGLYSDGQATFFDYTYAADGFTLTAGVQVAAGNTAGTSATSTGGTVTTLTGPNLGNGSGLAGQPDVYVGADYSGSWGRIYGTYYYDSSVAAGAYKVGYHLSLADYIPGGSIGGWYMADDGKTDYVHGHVWGVTAQVDLSDSWILYAGYSDWDYADTLAVAARDDQSDWTAGLSWNMASGLNAKFEYNKSLPAAGYGVGQFIVRVTRSF